MLTSYIDQCKLILKQNMEYMYSLLVEYLSDYCIIHKPCGGYFIWILMRDDTLDTNNLLQICIKNKVSFHSGNKFSISGKYKHGIRLSFSWYITNEIKEGIIRLRDSMDEWLNIN